MPSTYTSGIRLEQPADGEQSTTWGDTLNRDLALIDFAISGITTITTTGGTISLTAIAGQPDQSRAAIIQLAGTLTANLNLIFPAGFSQCVRIRNVMAPGSYTLGLACAGGGGGMVLPGNWGGMFFTDGDGIDFLTDTTAFNHVGVTGFLTAGSPSPISNNLQGLELTSGYLELNAQQGSAALQIGSSYSSSIPNSGVFATFFNGSTTGVGSITTTGTTASYNTTSDYRAKLRVRPMRRGIDRLMQLRPCRGAYRAEPGRTVDMMIAHEVARVVPEAVHGRKDAVDADGKPLLQQLDHSKLVPLLVAALQEAVTRIERLERRVAPRKSWLRVLLGL